MGLAGYPKGCGCKEEGGKGIECCISPMIFWDVAGLPMLFFFVAVLVKNLLAFSHVRGNIKICSQSSKSSATADSQHSQQRDPQVELIEAVATQAFLYVAAFNGALAPRMAMRIMEAQKYHDKQSLSPLIGFQARPSFLLYKGS